MENILEAHLDETYSGVRSSIIYCLSLKKTDGVTDNLALYFCLFILYCFDVSKQLRVIYVQYSYMGKYILYKCIHVLSTPRIKLLFINNCKMLFAL